MITVCCGTAACVPPSAGAAAEALLRWLGHDFLLRSALEGSRFHRAVSHRLERLHNVIGLVVVGFAKRRGPRQTVVHRLEHLRKLAQRLDARIPRLRIHLRRQLIMRKLLILLKPFVSSDNLVRVGRRGQDPRDQQIGISAIGETSCRRSSAVAAPGAGPGAAAEGA
jgi:hypothetical protein